MTNLNIFLKISLLNRSYKTFNTTLATYKDQQKFEKGFKERKNGVKPVFNTKILMNK